MMNDPVRAAVALAPEASQVVLTAVFARPVVTATARRTPSAMAASKSIRQRPRRRTIATAPEAGAFRSTPSATIPAVAARTTSPALSCATKRSWPVVLITSGAAKADGHPAVALSDDARARLQADVDQLAQVFAGEVAAARPLDAKAVLALDARTFLGASAVSAGLADHVGPFSAALDRARSLASRSTPTGAMGATTGRTMTLLALLGVATEADAVIAVTKLTATRDQVRALTGAETDDAALGTLHAWKRDAAAATDLRAQVAAEKAAAEKRERTELLDAAVASMRLTPAERAEDGAEGAFTTGMSNSALRAFAARPVTVGAANGPRQPTKAAATGAALTAEQREIAASLSLDADAYAQALAAQG